MNLLRRTESWDPISELEDLSHRVNRLFGLAKGSSNGEKEALTTTDWAPSCDISETDKEYRICAELPKVQKDGVHVTLENGVLTVQGERREEKEEKGVKFFRRELSYGKFMRRFTMPSDADASKVDAKFKDGMLNITIAKAAGKPPGAKEIAIH